MNLECYDYLLYNEWILRRIVGVGPLKFLRMLLSYKICAFGIILIYPGMAAECTAGDIVTITILYSYY